MKKKKDAKQSLKDSCTKDSVKKKKKKKLKLKKLSTLLRRITWKHHGDFFLFELSLFFGIENKLS